MFKYILLVFSVLLFVGCTKNTPDNTVRQFKNINKDAVLNATKRVLLLSDKEFLIHSQRNQIEATKRIAVNEGFTVNINENKILLEAYEDENITKAKLIITQKKDFINEKETKADKQIHNLLWDRINYILGLKENWVTCLDYRIKLNFDGILCDIVYNDNIKPSNNSKITDTSIKLVIIPDNSKKVELADINMSIYDNILLPIVQNNDIQENNTTQIYEEDNITIISYFGNNSKEENITSIDNNISKNDTIKKDQNLSEQNITIVDINSSIIPENNSTYTISSDENISTNKSKKKDIFTSDNSNLTGFAKKFMMANPINTHTINLALFPNMKKANEFINKNNIKDNTFAIEFTKGKKYVKLMYGLYSTKEEAKKEIESLSKALKLNLPTVERVGRKQELFRSDDINKSISVYK